MIRSFFDKIGLQESTQSFRGNTQYIGEQIIEEKNKPVGKVDITVEFLPRKYQVSFKYNVKVDGGYHYLKEYNRIFSINNDTETFIYFMVQYINKDMPKKWEELSEARVQVVDRRAKEAILEKFEEEYGVKPNCDDYSHDKIGIIVPAEIRNNMDLVVSMVQNPEFIKLSKQLKKIVNTYKAVERL